MSMQNQENKKLADIDLFSSEVEDNILGCILIDETARKYIKELEVDDFYINNNQIIFKAIKDLHEMKKDISIISIREQIKNQANINEIFTHLVEITEIFITSATMPQYIKLLKNYSVKRKIKNVAIKMVNMIKTADVYTNAEEIKKQCMQELLNIKTNKMLEIKSITEVMASATEDIENNYLNKNNKDYYTGFFELDKVIDGLHKQEFTVIAGRPGTGKTSLALNIAENISKCGIGTYFASVEMSEKQLGNRLISSRTGIDSHKLRCGWLNENEFNDIAKTAVEISELKLFIDDKSTTIQEVENNAIELKEKHNIGLVVVDYLQLLNSTNQFSIREREVAEISRKLKIMSKDLDIPVIALCQLNRETEKRKKPILADLRESGAIEQDADNVIFLYADDEEKTKSITNMEVIIAKQRNGPTGVVKLRYNRKIMKFINSN